MFPHKRVQSVRYITGHGNPSPNPQRSVMFFLSLYISNTLLCELAHSPTNVQHTHMMALKYYNTKHKSHFNNTRLGLCSPLLFQLSRTCKSELHTFLKHQMGKLAISTPRAGHSPSPPTPHAASV